MAEQLRTVRLYGRLGAKFGRVHHLAIATTGEAIVALCNILPGFEKELLSSHERGIGYACFIGKENINQELIHLSAGKNDIRIAPIMQGRKSGAFAIIAGVALIAASFFLPVTPIFAGMSGAVGGLTWSGVALSLGSALVLSGISQYLAKPQRSLSTSNVDNGQSYNFNGPVNRTAQGNPVPLGIGYMITGPNIIGSAIISEDQ